MLRRIVLLAAALTPLTIVSPPVRPTEGEKPRYKNPLTVTLDASGKTARVVLSGTKKVAVVDLTAARVVKELPLPDDALASESHDLSIHAPSGMQAMVRRIAVQLSKSDDISNLRGACLSPDRRTVYLVHQSPRSQLPATQVEQGWVFTNALTSVSIANGARYSGKQAGTVILDEPNRAFANPSDVVASPDGKRLYIACAGADCVAVVDAKRIDPLRLGYPDSNSLIHSKSLIIAIVPTEANPRRLAVSADGKAVVASNFLADSLTVIDGESLEVRKRIPLGGPPADAARRGAILFHSSRLTRFGQFACSSCHPDGGADGLNWDLPRDGIGNFKNTRPLWGVRDTAPYGWLGSSPTLTDRIRGTLRTAHRYEPSAGELRDLVAYLETLPPPKPMPPTESDRAAVERGRRLFLGKARCKGCHPPPTYQDGRVHSVGTGTIRGEGRFDTPSLRGLRLTAPYLHDGSAKTIEEVFTVRNPRQLHGNAHELSADELADLIAFLRHL